MNWEHATKIIGVNDIPISDLNLTIIKRKYHKLSLLHHPDKNNNTEEAKIKFQEINEAYSYFNRNRFIVIYNIINNFINSITIFFFKQRVDKYFQKIRKCKRVI